MQTHPIPRDANYDINDLFRLCLVHSGTGPQDAVRRQRTKPQINVQIVIVHCTLV